MKKLFLSLLLLFVIAPLLTAAQEIPKESWAAMPRFLQGKEIDRVSVFWHMVSFSAEFGPRGTVTNMAVYLENVPPGSEGTGYYYPTPVGEVPSLKNPTVWEQFAHKVRSQFAYLDEGLYVEVEPYTLMAKAIEAQNFEFRGGSLIFQGTNGWRAISIANWMGKIPALGERVYLGRQAVRDEKFFGVSRVGTEYLISPALLKEFEADAKAAAFWEQKMTVEERLVNAAALITERRVEEAEDRERERLFKKESPVVVLPPRSEEKK